MNYRMRHKIFKMFGKVIPFTFLLFVVLSHSGVYGQGKDNNLLPVITLPSPEVAALGKYGVWPVSQYTGVPNISVPVYNININGFSLPITLNYHAGGVKIDDKASWVGTGWSLGAGGMIGRTVVGIPDEENFGVLYRARYLGTRLKDLYNLTTGTDYNLFLLSTKGNADTESDTYYYNFAGFSGKLIVDSNYNVRTIPASNLKFLITPFSFLKPSPPVETAPYYKWIIADANGNIYKFGSTEKGVENTTIEKSSGPPISKGITGLYLAQIILANKADTIHFEYDNKSERYGLPYTQSCRAVSTVLIPQGYPASTSPANGCATINDMFNANTLLYNGVVSTSASRSYSYVTGPTKLRKISWRGGQIEFKSSTVRQDMVLTGGVTGTMLDSVNVFNKQGARIKSTKLEYTYVNGRYYLDSLRETGSTATEPLRYGFAYINRNLLPPSEEQITGTSFNTYAQDHWGYFNAALANTNLLPVNNNMPGSTSHVLTSNREADTAAMQCGTLNRITYPTGGYTDFKYEANRYDPVSPIGGGGPPAPIITAYASATMNINQPVGDVEILEVPFDQSDVSIWMHFNDYAHPPHKTDAVFQYVKVQKLISGSYTNVYYWDAFDNFPSGGVSVNPRGFYDFDINATLSLGAGTYRIIVNDSCPRFYAPDCLEQAYPDPDPNDDHWIIPRVSAQVTYKKYDVTPAGELPIAGGLRIKEIASFTDNTLATRKKYTYDPGNLLMYPGYMKIYERYIGVIGVNQCYSNVRLKEVTGTSQTILGFTQGAAVGYAHVKEEDLDASNNNQGYTNYNFSFTPDSLSEVRFSTAHWQQNLIEDPTFPANSFEYKRGLLLSRAQYKKNGAGYTMIDSLDNKYDFNDYNTSKHYYRQRNLRIQQQAFGNWGTPLEESPYYNNPTQGVDWEFSYSTYYYISSWVQQLSSEQITYDQNGANPLTNLTKYYYDNPAHMLATRVETTNSKGEKLLSHTSYPQDYASGTTFIDNMVAENIIATPIENISYLLDAAQNVNILKGVVSVYKAGGKGIVDRIKVLETSSPVALSNFKFSNTTQGLLPFNTTTRTTLAQDSRYVDRVIVPVVNAYGNTNEQLKANDAKEIYFWGYKGLYPVAKLVGVDYSVAQTYITQSILDNATGNGDDAALRTELNKLRNVPGAQVTTFTYKPLVGITSQTDPSGKVVFYEYDAFGRLKLIKDLNEKILKQYDYQYKVPITQ